MSNWKSSLSRIFTPEPGIRITPNIATLAHVAVHVQFEFPSQASPTEAKRHVSLNLGLYEAVPHNSMPKSFEKQHQRSRPSLAPSRANHSTGLSSENCRLYPFEQPSCPSQGLNASFPSDGCLVRRQMQRPFCNVKSSSSARTILQDPNTKALG